MELEDKTVETEVTATVEEVVETPEVETETEAPAIEAETAEVEEPVAEDTVTVENTDNSVEASEPSQEEYTAAKDKKDDEEESEEEDSESAEESDDEEDKKKKDYKCGNDDDEKKKKDYSLEEELEALKTSYAEMETKYQELVAFKEAIDSEKKDALIDSFYMLSDEDKKDVIENKANYSLEEIEAKLSVICVRKKVNFDLDDTEKNEDITEEEVVTTYSLNNEESISTPAWLTALKNTRNNKE